MWLIITLWKSFEIDNMKIGKRNFTKNLTPMQNTSYIYQIHVYMLCLQISNLESLLCNSHRKMLGLQIVIQQLRIWTTSLCFQKWYFNFKGQLSKLFQAGNMKHLRLILQRIQIQFVFWSLLYNQIKVQVDISSGAKHGLLNIWTPLLILTFTI